jgi:hypothetical protein
MSSERAFDAVWNWSENNDCPIKIWRDEDGDWRVTVETRDGKSWRRATGVMPSGPIRIKDGNVSRMETGEEFNERIRLHMKRIVKQAYDTRLPVAA